MKEKEVITGQKKAETFFIEEGESLKDAFERLENRSKGAWIFLHKEVIEEMLHTRSFSIVLTCTETKEMWERLYKIVFPQSSIFIDGTSCADPDRIIFVEMSKAQKKLVS